MKNAPVSLLNSGNIIKQKWMRDSVDDVISIDFIIEYIKNQIDLGAQSKQAYLHPMLILRAATGSGKSTVLPVHLYKTFAPLGKANILMSQPTRITATDIPLSILKYNPEFHLEENIGFQTGVLARKPRRGIIFVTIGILLQYFKIMSDEDICKKFGFIVIDEVHNRSIDLDQTLCYVKKFLDRIKKNASREARRPYFILMSATFRAEVYLDYFGLKPTQFIDVRGISYPIEKHFAQFDVSDYTTYILDLVLKIHIENLDDLRTDSKHILVFLQGAVIIKDIVTRLTAMNTEVLSRGLLHAQEQIKLAAQKLGAQKLGASEALTYEILPIPLLSESISRGSEDYLNLYKKTKLRKVILATNVVETGITIPDLKYVIESGFVKEVSFNPNFGCTTVIDKNVNQSSARQRMGRVGRNAPGVAYMCYAEKTYDSFYSNSIPDILKEDIAAFMLNVAIQETKSELILIEDARDAQKNNAKKQDTQNNTRAFQLNKFEQKYYQIQTESVFTGKLDLISPPSCDAYIYAMEKLYMLGFIDHELNPTLYGLYANKIRKLRLENIRMILAGYHFGVSILDLITIACMAQIKGTENKKPDAIKPVEKTGDDFIDYLHEWRDGQEIDMRVVELRDEVIENFLIIGLNPYYASIFDKEFYAGDAPGTHGAYGDIKRCVYEGYRLNACTWNEKLRMYIADYYHFALTVDNEFLRNTHVPRICVASITLQSNKKNTIGLYKFTGKCVSFN